MLNKNNVVKLLFIGLVITILYTSCKKLRELVKAEIPVEMEVDFVIPVITDTGYTTFNSQPLKIDIHELIRASNNQVDTDNIKSVKLNSCTISINEDQRDPESNFQDFAALTTAFSSDVHPDWIQLASIEAIPSHPYLIDLPVNKETELKDYIHGKIYNYRITGRALQQTDKEIACKAKIGILVQATLK